MRIGAVLLVLCLGGLVTACTTNQAPDQEVRCFGEQKSLTLPSGFIDAKCPVINTPNQ